VGEDERCDDRPGLTRPKGTGDEFSRRRRSSPS
jgi:hypothetical protein